MGQVSDSAAPDVGGARQRRGRVVVVGDVGGQAEALWQELVRLGADPLTGRLPDDLTVVQVGDLVHRGPESERVVALVDRYLTDQPGNWVQLVGNHEAQYVRGPVFAWPERLDARATGTLRRWWFEGRLQVATTVWTPEGSHLVTHAGVTVDFWREVLGSPSTAQEAAAALNSLVGRRDVDLFRPGRMLHGARPTGPVGPLWASAATELLPGWLGVELPFSQVHGHSSAYDFHRRRSLAPPEIADVTVVDETAKHETTTLTGGRIVGVDPGHQRDAHHPWRAWEASRGARPGRDGAVTT